MFKEILNKISKFGGIKINIFDFSFCNGVLVIKKILYGSRRFDGERVVE